MRKFHLFFSSLLVGIFFGISSSASVRVDYDDNELPDRKEIEMIQNIKVDDEQILILIFKYPTPELPRRNTCWIRMSEVQRIGFQTAAEFYEHVRPWAPPVIFLKNRATDSRNFCTIVAAPALQN